MKGEGEVNTHPKTALVSADTDTGVKFSPNSYLLAALVAKASGSKATNQGSNPA